MKRIQIALLTTLLLLPASSLWAQPDLERYSAEVCNKGQITVDVAVAYKAFGFSDEYWVIDGWKEVRKGKCETVFAHSYVRQDRNWVGFRSFPVHLAFAFIDSTGVYGAAKVNPPRNVARSRLQLCVAKKSFEYRVDAKDPATACKGQPGAFLIPASIDFEPTAGDYVDHYGGRHGPSMSVTVALGPNDRASPLGPQASTGGAAQGPGILHDMAAIMRDAVTGPGAPKLNISSRNYAIKNLSLEVCAPTSVVQKASWSDPQSARTRALKAALRQFVASHQFKDANAADSPAGYAGYVMRKVRVTEAAADQFSVQEVADCPGDSYAGFGVAAVEPRK